MVKLAIILGVLVAMLATIASLGVVVVDVREGGPNGNRIVVPVPLVLRAGRARASRRSPSRTTRCACAARRDGSSTWASPGKCSRRWRRRPDGEYVRVEERDELVVVRRRRPLLQGQREERHARDVSVNVPINLALQALPGSDGRASARRRSPGALSGVRFTDLVGRPRRQRPRPRLGLVGRRP